MPQVKIFWDPGGFELDSVGKKKYVRTTDGDTPFISMSIRMLSMDAPEVHYPGSQKPSKQDDRFAELAEWIRSGKAPVNDALAKHLHPRLATGKAGTLQEQQGITATKKFEELLEQKLTKPGGGKRDVFLWAADEHFDQYGRLLAYMVPSYTPEELAALSPKERATFNLLMVESGWAASFPIYPSLPKHSDLVLLHEAAKGAYEGKKGVWDDPMTLTGYEFRMCVRLYEVTKKLVSGKKLSSGEKYGWVERFCADMTTREILYPQDYCDVKPSNRIFVWSRDVSETVGRMNLVPAGAG